jgi:hypothetical protein
MPAVANVIRFKGKPRPAARFDGSPESVAAILEVARKCDSDAQVAVVPELDVVVVRWERVPDDHPPRTEYEVVVRGGWLAFSEQSFSIYGTDDKDLEYWYERV